MTVAIRKRPLADSWRGLRLLRLVAREGGWLSVPRHAWLRLLSRWRERYVDDFVFIHINKCGGTSVCKALGVPLIDHDTAAEKRRRLGPERWAERFKFALVRNPFSKIVSHYEYRKLTNQTGLGENPIPFEEWVERAYLEHEERYHDCPRMFMPQLDWLTDADGEIIVDFIGRLETIESDFAKICGRLGRRVELPYLKASGRGAPRDYREYYSRRLRSLVESRFEADLVQFGYEF